MIISYCTTCHKRLWQLKQTIDHNLSFTKVGEFELCILAYNDDEVEPYLIKHYSDYIQDRRLRVRTHHDDYIPVDGSDFACGYVKNLSHEMGIGRILFNLDADNFIGDSHELIQNIEPYQVMKNIGILDGRSGRIAIHRELFYKVGGYRDVGRSDDGDFIRRCLSIGARLIHVDCSIPPLSNIEE